MRRFLVTVLVLMTVLTACRRADSADIILSEDSTESANIQITEEHVDQDQEKDQMKAQEQNSDTAPEADNSELVVFVCGAVNAPGVYYLEEGLRIVDAIEAAGGFSEEADKTYVNLAAPLSDGIMLLIPTVEEVANAAESGTSFTSEIGQAFAGDTPGGKDSGLVNINRASAEELKTLPGIGDGIAGKIIDYRTENGNFTCIEDIMKVSGIKDKLFSKIKDHITV